jgi:hypothetical protein
LGLNAQLYTAPLGSNIFQQLNNRRVSKSMLDSRSLIDTLELPFIDDFSKEGHAPLESKWLDNSVLINQQMAIKPPSIGVATFDGLNELGEPYSLLNETGPADTLTSHCINLNYPASDSLYLSFHYQPRGLGNFPEFVDTFLLEFKNPDDTLWTWIWSTKGEDYPQLYRDFKQVMVPIKDTAFLKKGFQFRFRNFAQLNGGWDHWHLDYVRLDRNRNINDTTHLDYSFMYPAGSLLNTYKSVPLSHFLPNALANMDTIFQLYLTSQALASDFKSYGYYFNNYNFPEIIRDSSLSLLGPIFPGEENQFTQSIKYTFEDPATPWTEYVLKHFIKDNEGDLIKENDTTIYRQILSNYYALDDGTAEERISINNNGGGFAAQKFDTYLGDTLKSIQFYFNQVNDPIIDKSFYLMVWGAGANVPGELLVNEGVHSPYYYGQNVFITYELENPIYLPAGSYYIGWAQNTGFDINIGFDKNTNNSNRIFYNLDGNWYNYAANQGTMMIRPMFQEVQDTYVGVKPILNQDWGMYPNPSNGEITIRYPDNQNDIQLFVYDISGRVVYNVSELTSLMTIDLKKQLTAGAYFIELRNKNGKLANIMKLILN